jgi:hypothetical protein
LERPLDLCATVAANGAGYVWRGTNFDRDLPERIAEAVRSDCFALLDIWELCTAYYQPSNHASKKTLATTLDERGMKAGLLHRAEYPEYAAAYRQSTAALIGQPLPSPRPIEARFPSTLDRPRSVVIAGSAGGKVRSAARLVGEAALVLSPRAIDYTAIARPDVLIVLSKDGAAKVSKPLAAMQPDDRVFVVPEAGELETKAQVTIIDPAQASIRLGAGRVALYCVAMVLKQTGLISIKSLEAAAMLKDAGRSEENLATIRAANGP